MTDYLSMPDELPEKPTGWTQTFSMHLNMGGHGHISTHQIKDDKGRVMPMIRQSHSKDATMCGFILPGVKQVLGWTQLRKIWPRWIERARKKQRENGQITNTDDARPSAG